MNPPDLEFWGRTVGVLAVEVVALAGLAWAGTRVARTPGSRKRIWQGALLSGVLLLLGEGAGLRQTWRAHATPSNSRPTATRRIVATVTTPPSAAGESSGDIPWPAFPEPLRDGPALHAVWWPLWLWMGGSVLMAVRAAAIRLVLRMARGRALPGDSKSRAILDALAPRLGLRQVHLCTWPGLRGPVAFGFLRPTIAIPSNLADRFSPAQQEAMMAHELAHLSGRDPLWLAVADLLVAALWWHPASWWMRRRFQAEAEATADTASALIPQGPTFLAESLVLLGRDLVSIGPVHGLGVAGRFRSELSVRIGRLMHGLPDWRPPSLLDRARGIGGALVAATVIVVLPLPGAPDRSVLSLARADLSAPSSPKQSEPSSGHPGLSPSPTTTSKTNSPPDSPTAPAPPGTPRPRYDLPVSTEVKSVYVALRDPSPEELLPPKPPGKSEVELLTRTYRLDSERFNEGTRSILDLPETEAPSARVWELFSACGIDFGAAPIGNPAASERALYFNATRGILFVRASLSDLDAVERVLQATQASILPTSGSTPRISLNSWFAEIVAGGPEDLGLDWIFGVSPTNNPAAETVPLASGRGRIETLRNPGQVAVLTGLQFAALQQRLSERAGVDLLHGPSVTTVSGREARVQVQDIRTIVTGVTARVDSRTEAVGFDGIVAAPPHAPATVEYGTEQMAFGPEVLVHPELENDRWNLQLTARVTEFLGYDDPGANQATIRAPNTKPMKATPPLPRLRIREASATAGVRSGEVVALRGPMAETLNIEKGGLFRRGGTNALRKRIYVFIQAEDAAPGTAGVEAAEPRPYPLLVRIPIDGDTCRIGTREVREFELTGVIRSLALAHPGLLLLIRNEPGVSPVWTRRIQDAAMEAGVGNLLIRPESNN